MLGLSLAWSEVARATNIVYIDRSKTYVCRVHRAGGPDLVEPAYTVRAGRYLEERSFPSNRLVSGIEQPLRRDRYSATLWEYAENDGVRPPLGKVGVLLHSLHHAVPPRTESFQAKRWNIPEVVQHRLGLLEQLQPARARYWQLLRTWLDRSLEGLDPTTVYTSLIHGDFKRSNVAYSGGQCTLLDLDSTCLGPPGYDRWRIEIDIHCKRIGRRAADEFADGYKYELPARAESESFARVARLGHTTLFELRLAEGADVKRRCHSYETWWQGGAGFGEIPGWISP
ncbi:aminoglycoside phosphotransferase family protein [Mycolicibacterium agri]|uniref:aminoglycoside phosphotransferase family protein n=1 Tax=Mycolicibacterium agri TaxID=36811 RepID=UPI0013D60AFE